MMYVQAEYDTKSVLLDVSNLSLARPAVLTELELIWCCCRLAADEGVSQHDCRSPLEATDSK